MFPHKNPLPISDVITTPDFEVLFESIKTDVLAFLIEHAPDDADAVAETFENESEVLTKFTQAFTVVL